MTGIAFNRTFSRRAILGAGTALAAFTLLPGATFAAGPADTTAPAPVLGSPDDPMQIVVSLGAQTITVYRGLEKVTEAPISSGKPGHDTPTGVFSILEKKKMHRSNLYDDAPMPFMQRLTWSGVALHAGRLPGYPASHGCVRLNKDFAKSLFGITNRGAHVVVVRNETHPRQIVHPTLFQPEPLPGALMVKHVDDGETEVADLSYDTTIAAVAPVAKTVADLEHDLQRLQLIRNRSDKPLRIVIAPRETRHNTRDVQRMLVQLGYEPGPVDGAFGRKTASAVKAFQEAQGLAQTATMNEETVAALFKASGISAPPNAILSVRQNMRPLFSAPVTLRDPDKPLGTHLFTVLDFKPDQQEARWMTVSADDREGVTAADALDRIDIPEATRRTVADLLTSGSSLIVTDRSYFRHTTLGTDFIVETRL